MPNACREWYLNNKPSPLLLILQSFHCLLGQFFFIKCFTGNFEKNLSRGGRNKNKNKTRNGLNIFYFQLQVTFCVRINEVKYMSLVSIIVVYRHIQWYFRYIPMPLPYWYICLRYPRHRQLGVFHKQIQPVTRALWGKQSCFCVTNKFNMLKYGHFGHDMPSASWFKDIWDTKCANIHNCFSILEISHELQSVLVLWTVFEIEFWQYSWSFYFMSMLSVTGGGKNKNKRKINHFYFYFLLIKVRVGSPVTHFMKNKRP